MSRKKSTRVVVYNGKTLQGRRAIEIGLQSKPDPIHTVPVKKRICMRCRKEFMSRGNFRCDVCHEEESIKNFSKREIGSRKRRAPSADFTERGQ